MVERLKNSERRILYVPIVHNIFNKLECRGMQDSKDMQTVWRIADDCPEMVKSYREGLDRYWDGVERFLGEHKIDKIYHDGFVEVSDEKLDEALRQAKETSRNIRAVYDLKQKGTKIIITESLELALKHISGINCNDERDKYVAERVNNTLVVGETGALFMGLRHKTDQALKKSYPSIEILRFEWDFNDLMKTLKEFYETAITRTNSERNMGLEEFLGEFGHRPFSEKTKLVDQFFCKLPWVETHGV